MVCIGQYNLVLNFAFYLSLSLAASLVLGYCLLSNWVYMSNKYHYLSPASAPVLKFGLVKMYGFTSNALQLSLLGVTSSKFFPWASVITCAYTQGKCLLGSAATSLTHMCSLNRYWLWQMAFVSNCASCMGICSFLVCWL